MRDDFRPRRREHFVVAGLIGVIVGVEERLHFSARGQVLQRGHHLVAGLRSAAVHQHEPVTGGESQHIAPPPSTTASLSGQAPGAGLLAVRIRGDAHMVSAPAMAPFKTCLLSTWRSTLLFIWAPQFWIS